MNNAEEIFRKRKKIVTLIMRKLDVSEDDAEDATMNAILKLLLFKGNNIEYPYTWVTTTALRLAVNAKKRKERESKEMQKKSTNRTKHIIQIKKQDKQATEIIVMRLQGMSWQEIANKLHISKQTAKRKCDGLFEEI